MSFSSSVESECSFGIRSAFSPYKPANTLYSQTPTPTILAHSQYSNIYRCQAWSAFEKAICYSVVQQNDRFGNADYNSAEYYEDRLMRNENARRRRNEQKKRELAMRDRIQILEYENGQMQKQINYLRSKLREKDSATTVSSRCEMFLVNFLNRNKTDSMFPLFELIYISETVFLFAAIALGIALILPICRMRYHINIRLRVLFSLFHGIMYPISRIIVIIHQYFGPIDNVEWMHIIVCGQIKQEFLGYFTTLIAILAIDRLIATKYWAWYERGGSGTLIFFVAQEIMLTLVGNTVGAALIFEYITDVDSTLYFATVIPVGTTIFIIIYHYNRREMVKMKKGAVIHRYSVAKTFQFKENIRMLELFTKIARPLIIVSVLPFLFYPIYALVPPGVGYDKLRYFSVAMYDLMLSIACVVVIGSLPAYEPSLRVYCCKKSHKNESVVPIPNNVNLTDAYFDMLKNDLK